ncbi:unnamed protein product, partial [Prunus brigantina]
MDFDPLLALAGGKSLKPPTYVGDVWRHVGHLVVAHCVIKCSPCRPENDSMLEFEVGYHFTIE